MYPMDILPDYWHVIVLLKVFYACMTYYLLKWVNKKLSFKESECDRQMKKMRKELTQTKEANVILTQQIENYKKYLDEYREKNKHLAEKLDFQETIFEREYEKRIEQEEKAKVAVTELDNAKLELSKLPMVKQIFKSKIRGLEKQLVWVMWRYRKKESRCVALQKSETILKEQIENLEKSKEITSVEIENFKKKILHRHRKDDELLRELKNFQTYLEKSPSVYKKGTKKKMVGQLVNILENSMGDFKVS